MFGYITPYRPELKMREDTEYRAHYCGLCRALGLKRGIVGRAVLRYDMAFIALLADAVLLKGDVAEKGFCAIHPFGRRPMMRGTATEFAADLSLLLLWGKLSDDRKDSDAAGWFAPAAGIIARSAARRQGEVMALITRLLDEQATVERAGTSPDGAAEPTARFMQGLIRALPGMEAENLKAAGWLGYNLGKWVYIIDAADDLHKDARRGRFNPLSGVPRARVDFLLTQCAAQAEAAFSMMSIYRHEGVLTNILSLGLSGMSQEVLDRTYGKAIDDTHGGGQGDGLAIKDGNTRGNEAGDGLL